MDTRAKRSVQPQPTNARRGIARRAPASRPARASSFPAKWNVWEAVISGVPILCAKDDKPCMFQSRRFHVWAGGIMAPLLPAHDGLAAVTPQNLCRTGTSKRRQNLRDPSLTKSPGTRNQGPPSDLARFRVRPPLKHDKMKKGKIDAFSRNSRKDLLRNLRIS